MTADPDSSGTVTGAVAEVGSEPVLVTELIDTVLQRHASDYLRSWARREPVWPSGLRQPATRWLDEARVLLTEPRTFGRTAVIAWSLLDDRVAAEAVASGILGGLAAEITPSLAEHLSPIGLDLLRRRAPLVALQEGLLPPGVDLPTDPGLSVQGLTLQGSPAHGRAVGRWALAFGDRVITGNESTHHRVYPPTDALPEGGPATDTTTAVTTVGWGRGGHLLIVLAGGTGGGLVPVSPERPVPEDVKGYGMFERWPYAGVAAVSRDAVAVATGDADSSQILWGVTGPGLPGGPVPMTPLGASAQRLAISGQRVAALTTRGQLFMTQDGTSWTDAHVSGPLVALAAAPDDVVLGEPGGIISRLRWDDVLGERRAVTAMPGESPGHLAAGGRWVVATSERTVAVLSADALAARWQLDDVNAAALSPDGRSLGMCVDGHLRIWRIDPVSDLRLTSYLADTPRGTDLLGVRPAVDALAALMTAHVVKPPLSVGLFGAWGSGKSFFMQRLHERIDEITSQARESGRPQSALWSWRQVRQIEFNAWHYAAADVWAGLLEELIRGVGLPNAGKGILDEHADERASRVVAAQETLVQAREGLRASHEDGERGILSHVALDTLSALDNALETVGLSPVAQDLNTTMGEVAATRETLRTVGWLSPGRPRDVARTVLTALLVAVLVFGAVAGLLLLAPNISPGLWAPAATLASLAAAAATWVREKMTAYSTKVRAVTEAEQLVRTAEAEVAEARRLAGTSTFGTVLNEYLTGRGNSEDYRASLGLIGTVHRDLRTISEGVAQHNTAMLGSQQASEDDLNTVNRIVLYIDDLDRCRPEIVVKVLEAVSMLLSFELFVVVVAVDAHWVSKSLATVYPTLLSGEDVTADNYLEKIFQLPVWLDRPGPEVATRMAAALMGLKPAPTQEGDSAARTVDDAGPVQGRPEAEEPGGADAPQDAQDTAPPAAGVSLATSPPAPVTLEVAEARAIAALAPMLARSPRALKRYINTYRLLKGLIEETHLERARLLLAVATGRPAVGERLLRQITQAESTTTMHDLTQAWPPEHQEWFLDCLPADQRTWSTWTVEDLGPAAETVRRFVFRTVVPSPDKTNAEPTTTPVESPLPPVKGRATLAEPCAPEP